MIGGQSSFHEQHELVNVIKFTIVS